MHFYTTLLGILFAFAAISVSGTAHHARSHVHEGQKIVQRANNPIKRAQCALKPAAPHAALGKHNSSTAGGASSGVIRVHSTCGSVGATRRTTATAGPNGSLDWLNCGINDGGWRPPNVKVSDLIHTGLATALKDSSSPFHKCAPYLHYFEKYGHSFKLPPILLASIAMQESTCNPDTVGQGGEQGLMQLSPDKCGGAPNGNCKDPDFNIRTSASYFASMLKQNKENILKTVGVYNGWFAGMTYADATKARHSSCCRCQNNLDYLHQFFNGWMQDINAYEHHLGKYFNLDSCPSWRR